MDLTSNSAQGGAGDVVQDNIILVHDSMREHMQHLHDAPDDGVGNDTLLNYADHVKRLQKIVGGTGSFDQDQGLDQSALDKDRKSVV